MTGHLRSDARKRLAEDTASRDEQGAADHAAILGRSEWIGSDVGDQEPGPLLARVLGPDPWGLPDPKPTTPLELPAEPPF